MKFICDKATFAREIAFAQEIIASRNALSILSNVFIEASGSTLNIRATDIKVGFETSIPIDTMEPGTATVFCDKLSGILSSIPDGDISVEHDESRVTIKPSSKKIRFQLKTISSEKFPELPDVDPDTYFQIPVHELKEMIVQTSFAVSDDETRYFMNGVYLERSQDGLVMVATNGRRLGFVRKVITDNIPQFRGVIIPPKILMLVQKKAPDEGLISLAVTEKALFVRFGTYKLSSTLIEGQFPNYQKVIPQTQTSSVVIRRTELMESIKRVSILVEQKSCRTFFALSDAQLVLSTEENDIGTAREEVACQYEGRDVTIAMNYKYLEDPLKVMKTEYVAMDFTEPTRAITFRPEPAADYFHVIMPMQYD